MESRRLSEKERLKEKNKLLTHLFWGFLFGGIALLIPTVFISKVLVSYGTDWIAADALGLVCGMFIWGIITMVLSWKAAEVQKKLKNYKWLKRTGIRTIEELQEDSRLYE